MWDFCDVRDVWYIKCHLRVIFGCFLFLTNPAIGRCYTLTELNNVLFVGHNWAFVVLGFAFVVVHNVSPSGHIWRFFVFVFFDAFVAPRNCAMLDAT